MCKIVRKFNFGDTENQHVKNSVLTHYFLALFGEATCANRKPFFKYFFSLPSVVVERLYYVLTDYEKLSNYKSSQHTFVNYICLVNNMSVQNNKIGLQVYKNCLQIQTSNIHSIMTERKKYFNNPITVRFSADEYTLREEQFAEMFPDLEPEGITNRVVFNNLFDRAFGKFKKSNEPRKEDLEKIQNQANEIGQLKIMNDFKEEELIKINGLYSASKESLIDMQDELENNLATPVIAKDQLLVTIPPIIRKVIEIEAATAKRKTGKEYSTEDILMQSFWDSVKVGRAFPWRTWSSAELHKIATDLKAAE